MDVEHLPSRQADTAVELVLAAAAAAAVRTVAGNRTGSAVLSRTDSSLSPKMTRNLCNLCLDRTNYK